MKDFDVHPIEIADRFTELERHVDPRRANHTAIIAKIAREFRITTDDVKAAIRQHTDFEQ